MIIYRHSLHTTNAHAQSLSRERFVYHTSCIGKKTWLTVLPVTWLLDNGYGNAGLRCGERLSSAVGDFLACHKGLLNPHYNKAVKIQTAEGRMIGHVPAKPGSAQHVDPGGCFTNVSRILQSNLTKIFNARIYFCGEIFKLKLCTRDQSMALGIRIKFQLEIIVRSTISAIHKFRENIFESSRNVSEATPRHVTGVPCGMVWF